MNVQVTSNNVNSRVNNVVNITAINVTKTLREPCSTQHHLADTQFNTYALTMILLSVVVYNEALHCNDPSVMHGAT